MTTRYSYIGDLREFSHVERTESESRGGGRSAEARDTRSHVHGTSTCEP